MASSFNNLNNNDIHSNNIVGIALEPNSKNNVITNNNVYSNDYGIYLYSLSNNNVISYNNIYSNTRYGISLMMSLSNNTITSNNISSNSMDGIYFSESDVNIITSNVVSSNGLYGVNLEDSRNNSIYHNCFIDNNGGGVQASDDNVTNDWNDTYPSGGNYWDDWITPNTKSGPYPQVLPGGDDFVDVPYSLDGGAGAMDYYPLTEPLPDLEVKNSDIAFVPPSPVANETLVLINATIHNIGYGNATDVIARFYDDDPGNPPGTGPGTPINGDKGVL